VPSWSPDMTAIAFVRAEPGRDRVWNLWARDLATGATTRLTRFPAGQVWGASWFPDSNRFAVSPEDRLLIADRSGRELGSYASPIARRLIRTPAVSPDGSRVVFQVFRDGVWVLDVASGQMRRVLDDATAEEFAWDPEGRHVAFHSRRGGQWRIWVMPV
jgi:YD repeat-containing protein